MPITTGNFQATMDSAVTQLTSWLEDANKTAKYNKIVRVDRAKKKVVREQDMEGMGALNLWPEGSPPAELDVQEGYGQSYTQHQYAGRVYFTKPIIKFGQDGLAATMLRYQRTGAMKVKEIICRTYLEEGNTAIASVSTVGNMPLINSIGGDGLTLFNASHTYRSDADRTWSNISTAGLDLTESTVNTVFTAIRHWTDNTGAPLDVMPTNIIFPPDLFQKFVKVRDAILEPATGNNAPNTYKDLMEGAAGGIQYQWLTSTTDWYVMTNASKNASIRFIFGWDDEVTKGKDTHLDMDFICVDFSIAHGGLAVRSHYKCTS
ncbi:MAG: hypothetical protein KKF27_20540 [Gammaproteobacteria bacterium]|nr:hypothetical protein [Gammaproteobacteria bacterium]